MNYIWYQIKLSSMYWHCRVKKPTTGSTSLIKWDNTVTCPVTVIQRFAAMISVTVLFEEFCRPLSSAVKKKDHKFCFVDYSHLFSEKLLLGKSCPFKYIKIRKVISKLPFRERENCPFFRVSVKWRFYCISLPVGRQNWIDLTTSQTCKKHAKQPQLLCWKDQKGNFKTAL